MLLGIRTDISKDRNLSSLIETQVAFDNGTIDNYKLLFSMIEQAYKRKFVATILLLNGRYRVACTLQDLRRREKGRKKSRLGA